MSDYRRAVGAVIEAIDVHSTTAWSWFDDRVDEIPEETAAAMDPPTARAYLVESIESCLYANWYCRGQAVLRADDPTGRAKAPRWTPFLGALSEANSGTGSSEPGWVVYSVTDTELVVELGGLRVWVLPDDVQVEDGADLSVGAAVRVRLPNELRKLSPGFYMALGDKGIRADAPDAPDPLVRLYWNLRAEVAPLFVGRSTRLLNEAAIAFQLKVVNHPGRYDRCDAGVIYTRRSDYRDLAEVAREVHRQVGDSLEPEVPALTKRLAAGVGAAEDPGKGESFGTVRCRLIAEGVLRAYEEGSAATADRLAVMAASFDAAGVDLDAPYLGPGSTDAFAPWS